MLIPTPPDSDFSVVTDRDADVAIDTDPIPVLNFTYSDFVNKR